MAELSLRVTNRDQFWAEFKDFLHQLNAHPTPEAVRQAPPPLAGKIPEGDRMDAYLAATALYLARRHAWDIPPWVYADNRTLHHPWFLHPAPRIRNLLIMESPPEFRERNIFVSENALETA